MKTQNLTAQMSRDYHETLTDFYSWCVEKQKVREELTQIVTNSSWDTNYFIFKSNAIPRELEAFYTEIN